MARLSKRRTVYVDVAACKAPEPIKVGDEAFARLAVAGLLVLAEIVRDGLCSSDGGREEQIARALEMADAMIESAKKELKV